MNKMMKFAAAIAIVVMLSGCSYHRITDPASGNVYYTNNWVAGRYTYSGAVSFRDAVTGKEVTLQSSEVETISKEEYDKMVIVNPNK